MDTNPPGGTTPPPPAPPPPGGGMNTPPPGAGGDIIQPPTPQKEPVIALLLNLFLLCVGYFWYGQWQKGIAALVGGLVIGVFTCGVGASAVAIFAAIDGYLQAQQLQQGHPIAQWTFFNDHR